MATNPISTPAPSADDVLTASVNSQTDVTDAGREVSCGRCGRCGRARKAHEQGWLSWSANGHPYCPECARIEFGRRSVTTWHYVLLAVVLVPALVFALLVIWFKYFFELGPMTF